MTHVELPEGFAAEEQKLPFFLAMEEFLARKGSGEYFFMWQVAPTVIFGRNQRIETEVNLDFCKKRGIQTYRRKSGGGCVYADRNNIMFSHITTSDAVATTFSRFTGKVAAMLQKLGIEGATASGRNDILIGDRKVSGYAFYHVNLPSPGNGGNPLSRAIVHGTMLYDADLPTMAQAITPSAVKLDAKGVASVRRHVTTVREHCGVALQGFKDFAKRELCNDSERLTDEEIAAIREIEQSYYNPAWLNGSRKHCASPRRIEGVGEFSIDMRLSPDVPPRIEAIELHGDFFVTGDLDGQLLAPLTGCELTREALTKALTRIDTSSIIHNLSNEAFADLLLNAPGGTTLDTNP